MADTAVNPIPEDFRSFKAFRENPAPAPAAAAEPAPAAPESTPAEPETPATEPAAKGAPEQEQEQDRDEHGRFRPKEPVLPPEAQAAVDKRISKAVAAQREAERRAAEAEARLAERRAPEPETTPKPAAADGKPAPPDPATWTGTWEELEAAKLEYFEKLADWKVEQREKTRAADEAKRQAQTRTESFFTEGQKLAGDFVSVAQDVGRQVTPDVASAIVETGEPKLVTYLHEHPDELARIGRMGGMAAAIEIGRLQARITQPAPEQKPVVSKAPKPPAPVGATAAPTRPDIYDEKFAGDYRAWKAAREAELARK